MFELLEDTNRLPVPEENIVQVHGGMNKVRVSVGNYISEPSDVYIITSEDGALLKTFIVFFLAEHDTHVIYGYADNPYDPTFREEVLQEAVDFVEEMGSILEEVPWEKMSPEERLNWINNESIYPPDVTNGVEEIVDLEEIEPEELQEVLEEEVAEEDLKPEEPEPDVLEEEEIRAESDESVDEKAVLTESAEEEAEEDGDFDNLLKKAFLKPDLVKKSRIKKASALVGEPREDNLQPEDEDAEAGEGPLETDEEQVEKTISYELPEEREEKEYELTEEEMEAVGKEDDLSALIQEISAEERIADTPAYGLDQMIPDSEDKTRLTIIRYLSRF